MIDEKKLIEVLKKHFDADYGEDGRLLYSDHVCTSDDVEDIIKLVEEQPRVGEWIPCSEMLPEKSGKYLGQRPYGEIIDIRFSKKHQKWNAHDSYPPKYALEIIAWMPLPEQYKVGDQE